MRHSEAERSLSPDDSVTCQATSAINPSTILTPDSDSARSLLANCALGAVTEPVIELSEPFGFDVGCGDWVCRVSTCFSVTPFGAVVVPSEV